MSGAASNPAPRLRVCAERDVARVAVLGIGIECNAFAPVSTEADFRDECYLEGDELLAAIRAPGGRAFAETLDALRRWEAVPVLMASAEPGGPVDADFFGECVARLCDRLRAAGRVDAVMIVAHGAGATTQSKDMDGDYFEAVRACVGPGVPVVATTDTHANVSDRMVAAVDVLIGYRTNPHVDIEECAAEAAQLLDAMLAGRLRPARAFLRLPLVTAQIAQLTAPGQPLGDLMRRAADMTREPVVSISVWSGFAFTDTDYNGLAILVTTNDDERAARRVARALAEFAWSIRDRFIRPTVGIETAVRRALEAGRRPSPEPRVVLADVGDNPGGGGRGNTMWLLEACIRAGVERLAAGVIFDPALAAEARGLAADQAFFARFNRDETSEFSKPLGVDATVLRHVDGRFTGTQGMARHQSINLGPSVVLRIGGIDVIVISRRQQVLGSEFFEQCGVDARACHAFLVKSRGHFRAGFSQLVGDADILEVDAPGLTTADLHSVPWRHLPRPSFPLDRDTPWCPPSGW